MTLFGKIIFGVLTVAVVGSLSYAVTSYMKHDDVVPVPAVTIEEKPSQVPETEVTASSTASTTNTVKADSKKIPFTEFLKQGGSYKCTVTQTVATMTTNGTVYIHDKNVEANFMISIAGQNISTNMIVRDGYTYTWTSAEKGIGHKTKMVTTTSGGAGAPTGTYTWNGSQVGDYSCEEWVADDSLFTLPKDVTFTEPK